MLRMYLVEARKEKGYSQRRTAREAGISFQHYNKIENGDRGKKVSFLIMCDIAKALDVSLNDVHRYERKRIDVIEYENEQQHR